MNLIAYYNKAFQLAVTSIGDITFLLKDMLYAIQNVIDYAYRETPDISDLLKNVKSDTKSVIIMKMKVLYIAVTNYAIS